MKIAIVHDSLTQIGGAERVLQAIHEIYPQAPVFTLVLDKRVTHNFEGWQIISSPLQYLYNFWPRLQYMLPFIPWALKFFDFSDFDIVLSTSSMFIKGITVPKNVVHINYCHTPARFLWLEREHYIKEEVPSILKPLTPLLRLVLNWLADWDYRAAQRVDYFLTNSENVQQRIKKYYQRDSTIIYPFVNTDFFYPEVPKENYYLVAGRIQAHKRVDLVVEAFNQLGWQLHVVGTGRALAHLKKIAKENVHFYGRVEDEILRRQYSAAKGFIFPCEEDFGITPLEAIACGTPVIAYDRGGIQESMIENKTAVFFSELTVQSLVEALHKFEQQTFNSEDLFEQAEKFSESRFKKQLVSFVEAHAHRG